MTSKRVILLSATVICSAAAGAIYSQDLGCGTVVPQTQIDHELEQLAAGIDYSQLKAAPQADTVPLTIHIVRSSSGTGGLSTADLNQSMTDLNALYVPLDISFYVCSSVDYIDDDSYYLDMSTMEQINALRKTNVVFGTINVYFVPNSSGFAYCGISSFTGSSVQGIVMNNACTAGGSPSTLAHEIGHYFDLYHTHETAFGVECPDGSNCATGGDLFCDTPADPNLSTHVSPYPDCIYDNYASTPDGCSGTYNPQTENLMSYSQKPCRDFWSAEQIAKAIYTLNNGRSELLTGCAPLLRYVGRSLTETGGDGDGLVEPGEAVEIDVTIENIGSPATGTGGLLSTGDTYITVTTPSALFDATIPIVSPSTTQTPFELSVAQGCPDPHIAQLSLDITADGGYSTSEQFYLFIGTTPGFSDDIETGPGYWSHYAQTIWMVDEWHIDTYRSHSGSSSWKMGGEGSADYSNGSDAVLVTQPFRLPLDASLTFWHWIDAEDDAGMTAWDGGIVLITDGSGIREQIHPEGDYPYTIIDNPASPFAAGTPCYSGTYGWMQATFDLSSYSGVVQLMFQFGSDGFVTQEGWYVDDITVTYPTYSTVTDIDGNVYQTIKIGDQWWMAENLKVTRYRNGDEIPNDTLGWETLSTGAYCNYDNDADYGATYGRLYNWHAVIDARDVAPEGCHVPTDSEWKQLEMYLGMSQSEADKWGYRGTDEGGKLKDTGTIHWNSPNAGATNESGFTALPGGYCTNVGAYSSIRGVASFWTSSEDGIGNGIFRNLRYNDSNIVRGADEQTYGFSVRCVVDMKTWYRDGDGDNYGDPAVDSLAYLQPAGYVLDSTDCDDSNPMINPTTVWYEDADGDTYGNAAVSLTQCLQSTGYVLDNTDCNDADSSIHLGASEYCNGDDDDCDGNIDEDAVDAPIWYSDADSDGYGDVSVDSLACTQPTGYVADSTDNCSEVYNPDQTDSDGDGIGDACCCAGNMGNVNCEGIVDIGDVTELIALLFIRIGDPFCCEDEADLDYNGVIDIGDLTILTNRLFITVTDPPPCQ